MRKPPERKRLRQPKRTKFRKAFKGRINGKPKGGFTLAFGEFGLKALEPERVTARQIEATRRAVHALHEASGQKCGSVYSRMCQCRPSRSKVPDRVKARAVSTVGVARVSPGRILFEIDGVPEDIAREALRLGAAKLPIKNKRSSSGLRGSDHESL